MAFKRMKDFFKIFFVLLGLLVAFLAGKGHGEKVFLESEEYKQIQASQDELEYTRAELENTKAKLQNIVDQGVNKKTDELLGQILQVFLADLGLRIQNRETLLKLAAKNTPEAATSSSQPAPITRLEDTSLQTETLANTVKTVTSNKPWTRRNYSEFLSIENKLLNSTSEQQILQNLERLRINNIKSYLEASVDTQGDQYEKFQGTYKGKVLDINGNHYGSLSFKLDIEVIGSEKKISGEIAFSSEQHGTGMHTFSGNSLGKTIDGLSTVVVNSGTNKFYQFYKLHNKNRIVGNYYEKMPNGTTKLIGKFILNRVDQF